MKSVRIPEIISSVKKIKNKTKVYLVGGAVRDLLMGIEPKDFDFVVEGKGIKFGKNFAKFIKGTFVLLSTEDDEARVVKDDYNFDFNGLGNESLETNLKDRDFTINTLTVDLDQIDKIIDLHSGLEHLDARKLVPVSKDSLKLDPLRLLRGFRFAVELGFELQRPFFIQARKVKLDRVAPERISYELMRILSNDSSFPYIKMMNRLGIFQQIMPEAQPIIKNRTLWKHSLITYQSIEELIKKRKSVFKKYEREFDEYLSTPRKRGLLKLAGLLHDIAKPHTQLITSRGETHFYGHDTRGAKLVETIGYERLKLSRADIDTLITLVKEHMRLHLLATGPELTDRAIRRFFRDLRQEYAGAMILAWADGYATAGHTRHLETTFQRMLELKRADEAKPKIERLINGYDLIEELKITPGPIFKIILNEVFEQQLEGKIKNRSEALDLAKKIYEANKEKENR
ncbi:MAG: HD domain-containing protein [candidate division WOR-3 bacterium]